MKPRRRRPRFDYWERVRAAERIAALERGDFGKACGLTADDALRTAMSLVEQVKAERRAGVAVTRYPKGRQPPR